MAKNKLTRVFSFTTPDTAADLWEFKFLCKLSHEPGNEYVVVEWTCPGLGSGTFQVEDIDITWQALLYTWRNLARMVDEVTERWNIEEERESKER